MMIYNKDLAQCGCVSRHELQILFEGLLFF